MMELFNVLRVLLTFVEFKFAPNFAMVMECAIMDNAYAFRVMIPNHTVKNTLVDATLDANRINVVDQRL
jgi:hypothetical protein